ncbi:leucine carboxyl methyltransferase [Cystobasidium minutum MCA 4210]|uniref:leucine carboxyl methyltransferase n=1 Tax=Cystobasidium minutum MCA 4210 TaxID=1397322 RepID=UPI0034CE7309|eukprot:jgi/Rhomi1/207375/estExt_Genemark1.C_1_t10269
MLSLHHQSGTRSNHSFYKRSKARMGDNAIRETDTDAAVSRLSAVNAGYMQDPFASCFVKRGQRRPPLINIGTFIRTWALDRLVLQFLSANNYSKKQVVSLGAGTDTRFFRLQNDASEDVKSSISSYVEIDFPEATTKKAMVIKKNAALSGTLGPDARLELGGTSLVSPVYRLVPGDLRLFEELHSKLQSLLDPTLPTLVIAECVFIYVDPRHSNNILRWFVEKFGEAGLACLLYDPVGLQDNFGKVMINNLQARGIKLLGVETNTTLQSVTERLQATGFRDADIRDVCKIRKEDLSKEEMERLSRLEGLDEVEELDLLLSHYAIAWGFVQGTNGQLGKEFRMTLP